MSNRSIGLDEDLYAYLLRSMPAEPEPLQKLREETAALGSVARMQIGYDQGQFMALLVRLIGAQRVLEVGCFTGYSSTAMAMSLPPDGRLITCDISEEYTTIAQKSWARAGVANKVELRLGPALETLDTLIANKESFDLAFIDADKAHYEEYWERCLTLVRRGGIILVDNVLWSGSVIDSSKVDEDTEAIRRLNGKIQADLRVAMVMLAIGDGLTMAIRL